MLPATVTASKMQTTGKLTRTIIPTSKPFQKSSQIVIAWVLQNKGVLAALTGPINFLPSEKGFPIFIELLNLSDEEKIAKRFEIIRDRIISQAKIDV